LAHENRVRLRHSARAALSPSFAWQGAGHCERNLIGVEQGFSTPAEPEQVEPARRGGLDFAPHVPRRLEEGGSPGAPRHGSKFMPEWALHLSPQQIRDVVAYLGTFKKH
jgi:hypothetical protein